MRLHRSRAPTLVMIVAAAVFSTRCRVDGLLPRQNKPPWLAQADEHARHIVRLRTAASNSDLWLLGDSRMGDRFLADVQNNVTQSPVPPPAAMVQPPRPVATVAAGAAAATRARAASSPCGTTPALAIGGAHSALGDRWMDGSESGVREAMEWQRRRTEAMLSRPSDAMRNPLLDTVGSWADDEDELVGCLTDANADPMALRRLTGRSIGVGGLSSVVDEVRQRVMVPLLAAARDPDLMRDLGVQPVRGLLLYGPPGCGKSLLARRLAVLLSSRPPSVVSGPELLDRFVGASEANVRALFDHPPPVEGRESDGGSAVPEPLHVIVFDEFDALGAPRGTGGGATGGAAGSTDNVRDSVVNQLLTKLDGVAALPVPTLAIALTNRRDLIDPALLRPGRFEVQIAVPAPDASGRAEILSIHLRRMFKSHRLNGVQTEAKLRQLAQGLADDPRATDMTGAELAGLVRAATARALERFVFAESEDVQQARCVVTPGDLEAALDRAAVRVGA